MKNRKWIPYWFCGPQFLFILLFMAYPIAYGLYLSFQEWNGLGAMEFVGLGNFQELWNSPTFWTALSNTFIYAIISMVGNVGMGLLLALGVSKCRRMDFYRFVFFLPVLLSGTAVALMWGRIYEPYSGILNSFLSSISLDSLTNQWLGDASTAMGSTLVVAIWKHCGFPFVLFLTAILSIPGDVYEAAKLDGVTAAQEVFHITVPMIRNEFATIVLLQMVNAMKAFDTIWVMTAGGPGTATTVLTLEIYLEAFRRSNYGYASALSTVLIAIIAVISLGLKSLVNRFSD